MPGVLSIYCAVTAGMDGVWCRRLSDKRFINNGVTFIFVFLDFCRARWFSWRLVWSFRAVSSCLPHTQIVLLVDIQFHLYPSFSSATGSPPFPPEKKNNNMPFFEERVQGKLPYRPSACRTAVRVFLFLFCFIFCLLGRTELE